MGEHERTTQQAPAPTEVALALTDIRKQFGSTLALDGAAFTLRRGTVHALLGENGAGKTTLMRLAFGMLAPDAGTLTIAGHERRIGSPAEAIAAGIGMVHQHFTLVPPMTVAENVALGGHGRYRHHEMSERVRTLSARHGLPIDPTAIVGTLPVSAQQRVEILKALAREAQILILDEPTAVLAPEEARALLHTLRDFVASGGSVVLITHKLRDALEFADDVTVLRRGHTVYAATAAASTEAALATAMLGSSVAPATPAAETLPPSLGEIRFTLHNVMASDDRGITVLKQATLTVAAGEIVGVAAVEGNGQRELLRILANRLRPDAGTVVIPEHVGFIPEDRQRDALILDFPLYENLALVDAGARRGTIEWEAIRTQTTQAMQDYDVRATSATVPARTLSGGNQQKLVASRELRAAPSAVVAENPTRGLDVQATAAIHDRLRQARRAGAAIVIYSSDLDEVLEVADRVVVLANGILTEVPKDRDQVGNAMLGRRA